MKKLKLLGVLTIAAFVGGGFALHAATSALVPGNNQVASVDSSGTLANSYSTYSSVSSDGRYVAFSSNASNLVSGDTNTQQDIFVRDRVGGSTTRVSVSSSAAQANDSSSSPSISYDGRYVSFASSATNLVSGDTNTRVDVFRHDRQTGTTELVSKSTSGTLSNSVSQDNAISGDGRFVAFRSGATTLVAGVTSGVDQIYVRDFRKGTTQLVSANAGGSPGGAGSYNPSMSCDGGIISFESYATNLVSGTLSNTANVFVVNRVGGDTIDEITPGANNGSGNAKVSCDGNYIAYGSAASNLVTGDTNNTDDIFRYNRVDGTTQRVSVSSGGTQANGGSYQPALSGDGGHVVFQSFATNLIASDTNASADAFIVDLRGGTTQVLSRNSGGTLGNGDCGVVEISKDGAYATYSSAATNLVTGDTNSTNDVFISETGF